MGRIDLRRSPEYNGVSTPVKEEKITTRTVDRIGDNFVSLPPQFTMFLYVTVLSLGE